MNDAQRETFAANGYIVVPGVLSAEQLHELNAVYDDHVLGDKLAQAGTDKQGLGRFYIGDRGKQQMTDRHGNTYVGRRFWSKAYMDLVDNQKMLPIMEEILGDPAWGHAPAQLPAELRPRFRLDHDNVHYKTSRRGTDPPDKGGGLHGNPENFHITCVYELRTVGEGDGGFGACPGSHMPGPNNALMDMPGIGEKGDWRTSWCDTEFTSKLPDWDPTVPVHRVEATAGDCVLFTEKMKHGTIPWSGSGERRTLFYKYVPYGMHHGDAGYDITDPELTPRQRSILEFSPSWFNEPRDDKDYSSNPGLTHLHPLAAAESDPAVVLPGWSAPTIR